MKAAGPAPAVPLERRRERRERLLAEIGDGIAVVSAAPELFRPGGDELPYRADANLFYLTGVAEPEAVAILTPHDATHRFTLFVRPRDPDRELWNGERAGVERAAERFQADAVYSIDELGKRLIALARPADRVFFSMGVDPALDERMIALVVGARSSRSRSGTGPASLADLDAVLGGVRRVKDDDEIDRMRTAAWIGVEGQLAGIARAHGGVGEWEIEAAIEARMRALGATGPAFPSIVGSGPNATTLHYSGNGRRVEEGDLVLIDSGAEWGMYCSDLTRTVPAAGTFSGPQRELYDVVLAAERAGIAAAVPDAAFSAIHDAAVRALTEGMIEVGLLSGVGVDEAIESRAYRAFYMHQTSHWIGLNVHDVGAYAENGVPVTLGPGMVLTVEPGIYVRADDDTAPERFRGIGIRIEDTVLVTAIGNEVLTRGVPTAPDEVEGLVG